MSPKRHLLIVIPFLQGLMFSISFFLLVIHVVNCSLQIKDDGKNTSKGINDNEPSPKTPYDLVMKEFENSPFQKYKSLCEEDPFCCVKFPLKRNYNAEDAIFPLQLSSVAHYAIVEVNYFVIPKIKKVDLLQAAQDLMPHLPFRKDSEVFSGLDLLFEELCAKGIDITFYNSHERSSLISKILFSIRDGHWIGPYGLKTLIQNASQKHFLSSKDYQSSPLALLMDCRYLYHSIYKYLEEYVLEKVPFLDLEEKYKIHLEMMVRVYYPRFNQSSRRVNDSQTFMEYISLDRLSFRWEDHICLSPTSDNDRLLPHSVLCFALMDTNYPAIKLLLDTIVDIDIEETFDDGNGFLTNAIGYAIINDKRHYETACIIRLLSDKGFNINYKKNDQSWTPLQMAILLEKHYLIHILMTCGSDPALVGDVLNSHDLIKSRRDGNYHSCGELMTSFIETYHS